jgi:FlaA1/EpsC-like NDP-sugar epimerase
VTWTNPRNAAARILEARARYLALRLRSLAQPFAIWGAGQTGRRLARALEAYALRPALFVDIDPRKIGGTARGLPIVSAEEAVRRARTGDFILVVAVGDVGARDVVRDRLAGAGLAEGRSYVCGA